MSISNARNDLLRLLRLLPRAVPSHLRADVHPLLSLHGLSAADGVGVCRQCIDRGGSGGGHRRRDRSYVHADGLRVAACRVAVSAVQDGVVEHLWWAAAGAVCAGGDVG